jgi:hypothetical protein
MNGVCRRCRTVHSHMVVDIFLDCLLLLVLSCLFQHAHIDVVLCYSYFYTFVFPSTALMPMEYCCPLMDTADIVGDAEFVATYREFLHDRTGVDLIIET